jgi:hypothetical protein
VTAHSDAQDNCAPRALRLKLWRFTSTLYSCVPYKCYNKRFISLYSSTGWCNGDTVFYLNNDIGYTVCLCIRLRVCVYVYLYVYVYVCMYVLSLCMYTVYVCVYV